MSKAKTHTVKLGEHRMRYEIRLTPDGWRVLVWTAIGGEWDSQPTTSPEVFADPRKAKNHIHRNLKSIRESGEFYS